MNSLLLLSSAFAAQEMVKTPHGMRLAKCVHTLPNGAVVEEQTDGSTLVTHTEGSYRIEADEDCIQEVQNVLSKNRKPIKNLKQWEDYASFTSKEPMYNFTSTYGVPNEQPKAGSQLLYYFIGFENKAQTDVTIVQPVVNYDQSGQYPDGWSMEPWNCCPSGQSLKGANKVISAGDDVLTWIYTSQGEDSEVTIGLSATDGSDKTEFTVKTNRRVWDWASATLEDYSATCEEKNAKPFDFNKMVITDAKGKLLDMPWTTMNQTVCKGGAVVNNKTSVSVYGKDKPRM